MNQRVLRAVGNATATRGDRRRVGAAPATAVAAAARHAAQRRTGRFDRTVERQRKHGARLMGRGNPCRSLASRYDQRAARYRARWLIAMPSLWRNAGHGRQALARSNHGYAPSPPAPLPTLGEGPGVRAVQYSGRRLAHSPPDRVSPRDPPRAHLLDLLGAVAERREDRLRILAERR